MKSKIKFVKQKHKKGEPKVGLSIEEKDGQYLLYYIVRKVKQSEPKILNDDLGEFIEAVTGLLDSKSYFKSEKTVKEKLKQLWKDSQSKKKTNTE